MSSVANHPSMAGSWLVASTAPGTGLRLRDQPGRTETCCSFSGSPLSRRKAARIRSPRLVETRGRSCYQARIVQFSSAAGGGRSSSWGVVSTSRRRAARGRAEPESSSTASTSWLSVIAGPRGRSVRTSVSCWTGRARYVVDYSMPSTVRAARPPPAAPPECRVAGYSSAQTASGRMVEDRPRTPGVLGRA